MLRYECGATLPALQRRQLEQLDRRLDQGIELDGENIAAPDAGQRLRFVLGLLLRALPRGEDAALRGLCTWLGQRVPGLAVIHIHTRAQDLEVELEYAPGRGSDE